MARSLSSIQVSARIAATLANTIDNAVQSATCSQGFSLTPVTTLANGTSANQCDRVWSSTARALTSGGSENIDMYDLAAFDIGGGAGKDATGQSFTNVECVALLIRNNTTSAGTLIVGGEGSAAAWQSPFMVSGSLSDTAQVTVGIGGWFLLFAPADPAYPIADTSNHLLKIAASGGAATYDAAILFRSA
jgi:hypothetical protein